MSHRSAGRLATLLLAIVMVLPATHGLSLPAEDGPPLPPTSRDLSPLNLNGFLENGGQIDDARTRFHSWGPDGGLAFRPGGLTMTVVDPASGTGANVALDFEGTGNPEPEGMDPLPGTTNFLKGRDPSGWRTGLRTYGEVVYRDLYEGIDAVYRTTGGQVKYDLVLRPGADITDVRVGVNGHAMLDVDPAGDLVIGTAAGALRDSGLRAFYADDPGAGIECHFRLLDDRTYGFHLGEYDRTRTVIVDPLLYSTFVGGAMGELEVPSGGPALDSANRPVVVGFSNSTDFPVTPGAFQASNAGGDMDIFAFRLSENGTDLEWATYIGGSGYDFPYDMLLTWPDRPIIVGRTNSTDFPTTSGVYRGTHSGPDQEGFVLRLAADGSHLEFGTYIGGSDTDEVTAVLDGGDHIFFAGNTKSTDLPVTPGAFQQNHSGGVFDVFIGSLGSAGQYIEWMSYMGGTHWDTVADMDEVGDLQGDLVIVGRTGSEGLATNGTYQNATNGNFDAYVAKVPWRGSGISSFTYLGGFFEDMAQFVDAGGVDIVVAGYTESPDFPTTNMTFQPVHNGSADIFVTRIKQDLSNVTHSTFLGGSDWETCEGFAKGGDSTVYVTGRTLSNDLPMLPGTYQPTRAGNYDAYVARLSADFSELLYSSYLGGTAMDIGSGVVVDGGGNATIVGGTDSTDFPTTASSYQPAHGGRVDVFVTRMDMFLDLEPPRAVPGRDVVIDQGETLTFDGSGSTDNVGVVNWTWTFRYNGSDVTVYDPIFNWTFDLAGRYFANLTVRDAVGLTDRRRIQVLVRDIEDPVAVAPEDMVGQQHWTANLDGGASHDNVGIDSYFWTFVYNGTEQNLSGSRATFTFREAGIYLVTLTVVDAAGNLATDTMTLTILDVSDPVADAGPDLVVGQRETVTFDATGSTDNVGIVNVTWQLVYAGAPISLYGNVTTFSFDRAGIYDVNLIVEDALANRGFDRLRVTVLDVTPPVAVAGSDKEIDQGDIVSLDASASSDDAGITSWTWTITFKGVPTSFPGQKNSVTFVAAGVHTVLLNVSDSAGNWDTDSFTVVVRDVQPPVAEAGENVVVEMGEVVAFNGSESEDNVGIISYTWTFKGAGEDVTLTGPAPEHTFEQVGTYLVTLTVLDGSGLSGQDQIQVHVLDSEPPVADAGADVRVLLGSRVYLNGSASTDNVLVETYIWTFNYNLGPVELTGEDPSFVFELKGTYLVTLTVHDPSGNSHSDETIVEVYSDEDVGGGGGGGSDGGGLFLWLMVVVVLVAVVLIVLVMRGRDGGEGDDMGWAPSETEMKGREETGAEGDDGADERGNGDGEDGRGEEG